MTHSQLTWSCQNLTEQQVSVCTFLHVALQHGSVSEDERVEDGLAGGVEGPVQADVTAGLSAAAVLAVNVAMDPGEQQVQTGPDGAAGRGGHRGDTGLEQRQDKHCSQRNKLLTICISFSRMNSQHGDELGSGQEAPQVSGGSLAEDSRLRGVLQDLPQVIQEGLSQGLEHGKYLLNCWNQHKLSTDEEEQFSINTTSRHRAT